MKKKLLKNYERILPFLNPGNILLLLFVTVQFSYAQVVLEKEIKITDSGLHFDGKNVGKTAPNNGTGKYDFVFGSSISAKGDCIKKYKHYIFMAWYRGGKQDRHVMLTRYNTKTGTKKTIKFPHRHTGFQNQWWLGEAHNTIAIGISKDGVIHLLYDMHSYSKTRPADGSFENDYFRYSFSKKNTAIVSDADFNLNRFVKDKDGDYRHLSLNGKKDPNAFAKLTYPHFFLNAKGDLFMWIRTGGNSDGAYKFTKYNSTTSKWSAFTQFNVLGAKKKGETHNWGLYGTIKFEDNKMRIGFQRRLGNNKDKYTYQNGFYYGYSDHVDGKNSWKNHKGENFSLPLIKADKIKVSEPGNLVAAKGVDKVRMVDGFDWTVTDRGDVHIIGKVKDVANNVTKYVHTYKKSGNKNFKTTTDFAGASQLYSAGNNIYIIGLNSNGRVYVEKAEGGTNNFNRVYEAKNGKRFRHGKVYIKDGKLYYYLMEKKQGSSQPLYLQVIDLDLKTSTNKKPTVEFTTPTTDKTVYEGYRLQVRSKANDSDGFVKNVSLFIDDKLIATDSSKPYEWGQAGSSSFEKINNLKAGRYIFKVVATDNKGAKSNDIFVLTVKKKDNPNPINCSFGTPRGSLLPSIQKTSFYKVYVLGKNGPDMSNIRKFSINWKAPVNGLYQFAFNTENGQPNYYVDLRDKITYNFRDKKPSIKITGSGIGVDGTYWVNKDKNNFVMVSKDKGFTLYFSNSSIRPNCKNKVGSDALEDDALTVYQNGLDSNMVYIMGLPKTAQRAEIYDIKGKIILSLPISEETNLLEMNSGLLTKGMYIIKVISLQKIVQTKFIKM